MKMTQIKLNVNDEILHGLFTQNDQGVAKLLEKVLNLVLRAQATEQLKAEPYERNDARRDYRNGFYPHQLTTRVGTLTLHVPRFSAMAPSPQTCLPAINAVSKR
jgi:putative transposase